MSDFRTPGWGLQAPQQQPEKKGKGCRGRALVAFGIGFAVVIAVIAVVAASGGKGSSSSAKPSSVTTVKGGAAPSGKAHADTVTYVVTGSPAEVTYGPSGSSFSHRVPLNVTKPLGSPSFYSISAQLQGGGAVTCQIKVNGKTVSKSVASGGYNIAMCEIVQDPFGDGDWINAN